MPDHFRQYRETDPLQSVILGRVRGYRRVEEYVEMVNATQHHGLPTEAALENEFTGFAGLLKQHGVEVLQPDYVGKFVYDQLTPRDLGITIGTKFVLSHMAKSSRRYEAAGIFRHILSVEGEEPTILLPPRPDILLEGGDIIVDSGHLFVGISGRTNRAGYEFLQERFGESFEVVPVECRSTEENPVLHLDCAFNPVGQGYALIYPPGLKKIPFAIKENYTLIEIDDEAQRALATNVLSLSTELVVSRDHPACERANRAMAEIGLEVATLPFDGAPATGGSFRCCTLPLVRS